LVTIGQDRTARSVAWFCGEAASCIVRWQYFPIQAEIPSNTCHRYDRSDDLSQRAELLKTGFRYHSDFDVNTPPETKHDTCDTPLHVNGLLSQLL
jgi:hypothetical protein